MAYAALVTLAQLLEQIILHHDQLNNIPRSEEQQLLSLHDKLSFLRAFLEDHSHNNGKIVHFLEAQIRDTAYQAQDIIESHVSEKIRSDHNCCGWLRGVCCRYLELKRSNYAKVLMLVMEQIDSIVEEAINIQRSSRVEDLELGYNYTSSLAPPTGRNETVVGLDEDLTRIKDRLCGDSPKLGIVSIVGMGGIGKTTLAKTIFDDSLVAYHFHIRAWVTVSQDYRLREALVDLLDSLTVVYEDFSQKTCDHLAEHVYKSLKGRTYLIVMDDMWSTTAWDDMRRIFPDDHNGSRIVITTRVSHVASYASSSLVHRMHFLNEDRSWDLLREKVSFCPPELEGIGRVIARNCGGLPLAIGVVAGILTKGNMTHLHWETIAENVSLAVAVNDEHFSKILGLSYDHLPCHLKACFLYMGGFPEDYQVPVSKLIRLWVAEGFLKPAPSKSLEEVAEECLEDLVQRNLVLITKKRSNGKFRFCGVHDLLRDLCIETASKEKFLHVLDIHNNKNSNVDMTSGRGIEYQRRLVIRSYFKRKLSTTNTSASALPIRSILVYSYYFESFAIGFRLLRVFDSLKIDLRSFPDVITELFHLRYLAFRCFDPKLIIPRSISKLRNLQTLIIHSLSCKLYLPFQMWEMAQLRHLILLERSVMPIPLAAMISWQVPVLENLQTLSGLMNFRFTRTAVKMIPNLKKLRVFYTGVPRAKWSKFGLDNLVLLRQLETLNFSFSPTPSWKRDPFSASFALPPNLRKLTLSGCRLVWEVMAVIGSLPKLEVLKLRDYAFVGREWESNEGGFRRLRFLMMEWLNLKCWRAESNHFPCLERLVVRSCWELEEIPCEIGDIATLELIEVGPRSKSAADSALLIQEQQRDLGNDVLQVRLYT